MIKIIPFVISVISLPVILASLLGGTDVNWEELALGKETISPQVLLQDGTRVYAKREETVIHCHSMMNCLEHYNGNKSNILWLGNSQLHAINQFKENEVLASELLYNKLQQIGVDLLAISHPSANLQEHYVISEYVGGKIHLDVIVVGLVFDDMREFGVRSDVSNVLVDPAVFGALNETSTGKAIIKTSEKVLDVRDEYAGLNNTQQNKTEQFLNRELASVSETWDRRPYLRGLFFNVMYKLRNYVFNINPSTKRKIIWPRYADNWVALEQLIESHSARGTKVVLYIAPIRDDVEMPYVFEEYEKFKLDVETLAARKNAVFRNYEAIVPAMFWGVKDSTGLANTPELDFMHFQQGGHKILSSAVYDLLMLEIAR